MKIKRMVECKWCYMEYPLWVRQEDVTKYTLGGMVQDCFPYLSPGERELIISGTCDSCWSDMFGGFDE